MVSRRALSISIDHLPVWPQICHSQPDVDQAPRVHACGFAKSELDISDNYVVEDLTSVLASYMRIRFEEEIPVCIWKVCQGSQPPPTPPPTAPDERKFSRLVPMAASQKSLAPNSMRPLFKLRCCRLIL